MNRKWKRVEALLQGQASILVQKRRGRPSLKNLKPTRKPDTPKKGSRPEKAGDLLKRLASATRITNNCAETISRFDGTGLVV
jgi:hypothetical protein